MSFVRISFKKNVLTFLEENNFSHFNQERGSSASCPLFREREVAVLFYSVFKGGSYFLLILHRRFSAYMHALITCFSSSRTRTCSLYLT